MKKLFCLLAVITFSLGGFAQDTKMEKDKQAGNMAHQMKDCIMMKDGKAVVNKQGNTTDLDKDMTLKNGTVVMTDGTVKMKDGKTMKLKDNDYIYLTGKMGSMKMHDKMDKKSKM